MLTTWCKSNISHLLLNLCICENRGPCCTRHIPYKIFALLFHFGIGRPTHVLNVTNTGGAPEPLPSHIFLVVLDIKIPRPSLDLNCLNAVPAIKFRCHLGVCVL